MSFDSPLFAEFPDLAKLSREDLEDMLNDSRYFQAIFHTLPQVKAMLQSQVEIGMANEELARNNLAMQEQLYLLRAETKDAFDQAKMAEARWREVEKEQREVYQVRAWSPIQTPYLTSVVTPHDEKRFSPQFLHMRLRHATTAQDDASEELASTFIQSSSTPPPGQADMNGKDVDDFVKEFKELRKKYHKRVIWGDRWTAGKVDWRDDHIFHNAVLSDARPCAYLEMYVNGVDEGHEVGIRVPTYDGVRIDASHKPISTGVPITDVTSNDLICNGGINPYQQPVSQVIISVPAGATVTAEWHHTLAGADPSDPADPIDPSHKGLEWFKIYEDGLVVSDQSWGVDRMIANKGKVTFSIPSCIASGQYLLRHEVIALHAATSYPGAQFYVRFFRIPLEKDVILTYVLEQMECAQLEITGGGSTEPATVSFPEGVTISWRHNIGITIDIYQTLPSYTVPGPSVFSCSSDSSGSAPSSVAAPPASSSAVSTPVAAPSPTSSAASGAAAAQYAQCGGIGFTGPTTCESPFTCQVSNAYVSML
ncbi:hypothetical protein EW145_g1744 [Phellinidium pouzarii]|uniref:AA9 family lytic polysaccharide monooxygenase n=1 Tax=Phellinidium pouzarii TaxID=167371 RepID=A0A4S4LDE5_9AGAM|nr:hypothetical protein EW145_g1744 [Phellinidium pouzarii]